MKNKYQKTINASFVGYIVQAIVNTFVPLLFVTFQKDYNIPIEKITLLITINYVLQLLIDLASTFLVDKVGYRICVVTAHLFAFLGLLSLSFLPELFSDHFIGLVISILLYAVGGGIIEVVVSPIVESCPSDHKEKTMSILHSFYCWGCVIVIVLSALFFFIFGINNWKILAIFWSLIPLVNGIIFLFVPLLNVIEDGKKGLSIKELFKNKTFWFFFVVIICAGASEAAIAQWSSAFVESSLKLKKEIGDLVGPAIFGVMMGSCRFFFGKANKKLDLNKAMMISGIICVISYLTIVLFKNPIISLIGMAFSGIGVALLWPGSYSSASASIKRGGNVMFALLALGGDMGCILGPTIVGFVSSSFNNDMKIGILVATIFPLILAILMIVKTLKKKKEEIKEI